MENKFKNRDFITNVFDTGIVKEYNKDTETITFCIKICMILILLMIWLIQMI